MPSSSSSSSRPEASGSSQPPSTSPSFNSRQLPTTSTSPFQQPQHLPSSSNNAPSPAGMSAQTRSTRPDGNSSSRGASPDYRANKQYEPTRRSRLSGEEERSGAGALLGLKSGGSSSRNASSESLGSNGGAGFAGRGAGHSFATSVGLPPINTHLQPQQQQQNSANMQSPSSSSNGSHGSSRLSMMAHPRPISTQGLPPPSSSLPHSPGFGGPRSPLAPPPSHSPREPHFPPSKSNSGSSTNSVSSAQRSPTHPPQPYNSNHPAPQPPSRPTSTSGHSGSSHGGHSHGHGGHELEERDRTAHRDAREKERERDRERRREGLSESSRGSMCAKCGLPMTGQFVRALGTVYHLDCFRCQDCSKVVANKFFPVEASDGSGKQLPLCETDYFRRLGLLCSKCGAALRGSYITALDMKFHVEHFTCSVCPTVFGPQDSYYEHGGSVYCHFHYSTRFAVKCTGCRTAILKQFVEINRNSQDEHWHPECYMIHKFWNIKLAPSPPVKATLEPPDSLAPAPTSSSLTSATPDTATPLVESGPNSTGPPSRALEAAEYLAQEEAETPVSLKNRQKLMEEQVYRIWTVLSAFEESSAACISEMLRHVSSGHYIEGVRMAEKFVLHVETLFSTIDDLSVQFKQAGTKEISHVREARMLCKKVVNFFSLLSHTHETGARKMSITQELLSLVTGLAHYLKILIRIALTAALKLEREFQNLAAIGHFLSKLDRLARDPEASKFSATTAGGKGPGAISNGESSSSKTRTYGYKSLTRAVGSTLVGQGEATTDLCEGCHLTVEEECARFGTSLRWHLACLKCWTCGKVASKDPPPGGEETARTGDENGLEEEEGVWLKEFRIEPAGGAGEDGGKANGLARWKGGSTYCSSCAGERGREGFEYVTRLEQYAFLLCVALNKLYALLKQRGVVPSSPTDDDSAVDNSDSRSLYDTYRDSTDIKRMKSVNLDRKLSSTTARIPKRSMVVQSPSGRSAQPNDTTIPLFSGKPPVPSRKDQPIVDPIRGTTIPASTIRPPMPNLPTSQRSLPPEATTTPPPPRPSFNRATTAIEIVDEPLPHQSSASAEGPGLGGNSEPTQDEEGITLADLPVALEAEQAREQHRHSLLPRSGTLLSELSALEYLIVRHVAALLLSSENSGLRDVVALDELLEIIDARKGTFWNKLFKGNKKEKVDKKKGVFGIPLEVLVERNGADSMHGAGPGSLRVPSFVDDVISAMKQMDMSVEGIFRKNGNIRRLKDLCEALDRDSASVNLSDDNPVQLAALLKKFLRDLPDPLLPYKLFSLFIATQRIENLDDRKKVLHLCCCLLPKSHRDTMEAIFVFLKWVASFSHVDEETGSKMDLLNLSTVVSPNILYSKGKDPAKDESFSAARAVHELLEHQDEFWQVPAECVSILNDQELFSNPTQLTSKEILARAENHVRFANRRAGSGPAPIPHRGEVQPQRPDFNQAYSAPSIFPPGSGPPSRPGSTNPLAPRPLNERPISFSTQAGAYSSGGNPLRHATQPPRSPVGSPPGRGMTSSPGSYRQERHYPVGDGYHPPPPRSDGGAR